MKRNHIAVPKPNSKFQKVSCKECGEQQVVFSHATTEVRCNSCGNAIAKPSGSIAKIHGKITGNVE